MTGSVAGHDQRPDQDLIDRIYAAPAAPTRWPEVLQALGRDLRSPHYGVLLRRHDTSESVGRPIVSPTLDELRRYIEEHIGIGVMGNALLTAPPLRVVTAAELEGDNPRAAALFRLSAERGLDHFVGAWFPFDDDHYAMLGMTRATGEPAPSREELDRLQAYLPHLHRALQMHFQLEQARAQRQTFGAVIDVLTDGLIVLDGHDRVHRANALADTVLTKGDGLTQAEDGTLSVPNCDPPLAKLLASAHEPATEPIVAVAHRTDPELRPYLLWAAPIHARGLDPALPRNPKTAVFVIDPERRRAVDVAWLVRAYGLTATEARVTALLAQGLRPDGIAAKQGVSVGTVRNQLKQAFAKTGTNSQPELVSFVLSASPRLG